MAQFVEISDRENEFRDSVPSTTIAKKSELRLEVVHEAEPCRKLLQKLEWTLTMFFIKNIF